MYPFSWRRKWQPTPVFLPGESHGQQGLACYTVHGVAIVRHDLVTKPPPPPSIPPQAHFPFMTQQLPLLGIYPEETIIQKDTCTPMFIVAPFAIARTQKQARCPLTDEWIKKL